MITAHLLRTEDAKVASQLIRNTLLTTNSADYSKEYLEADIAKLTPEALIEKANWTHFYVFFIQDKMVGTGAIGPYWEVKNEFSLFTIFVSPDFQGQGVGSFIIHTLEADSFFQHAKRVEIPASITAVNFYKKMGYAFKPGHEKIDEEGLFRMEKYPNM